jgi:hypothetical protein
MIGDQWNWGYWLGIIIPLGFQQWILHRQSRIERKKESDTVAEAIRQRDLLHNTILREFPLHAHTEFKEGECLTQEGIRYPKTHLNGG